MRALPKHAPKHPPPSPEARDPDPVDERLWPLLPPLLPSSRDPDPVNERLVPLPPLKSKECRDLLLGGGLLTSVKPRDLLVVWVCEGVLSGLTCLVFGAVGIGVGWVVVGALGGTLERTGEEIRGVLKEKPARSNSDLE